MILYICSSETDYGQDLLYAGLVQILGRDRILDWPFNQYYYFQKAPYPRNIGAMGISGLAHHWRSRLQGQIPWNRIQAVVVAACKKRVFETYLSMIDQIPSSLPVIFNDGGDFPDLGEHLKEDQAWDLYHQATKKRPFDLVLKREYLKDWAYDKTVVPFPFSFQFDRLAGVERESPAKQYQVAFWAVESHPIRTRALDLIENHFDCRENGSVRNQKFKKYKRKGSVYLQELKKVRVALNFRGVGWDTLRYWEVPALGGFMISEEPAIVIPNNYKDGQHVRFCKSDLSDLLDLCRWALDHPEDLERIGKQAQQHARQHHSTQARAQDFLNHLQRLGVSLAPNPATRRL